jgi:hypothetical protein
MKRICVSLITTLLLFFQQLNSQNNGAAAAITGTAVVLGILSVEELEEQAELKATEWILSHHPELTSFNLKTLDFNGKKMKDISSSSVISFTVQEFTPKMDPTLDGKKYVLFCFTSHGWVNEYGLDFDKVFWLFVDSEEWMRMMIAYTKIASEEKDDKKIREILVAGVIDNTGVKVKGEMKLPFYNLTGDAYLATDYSDDMKFIYNENSLCIFLKKTRNLIQMRRKTIKDSHIFLFP